MAAATIGSLRISLGASTAQYEAGMRRATATARATAGSISTSMRNAQVASTRAFAGIRNAAAGFGLGVGAIGVAGFAAAGRAALNYAANLGETSQQIGVTVEQLQILSRIAIQNGASQEELERSLGRLNRTLGEAKAGSESAARGFRGLGFTSAEFQSWRQGGDALRTVAERIARIPDPARQAAAAVTLFGRGGQQLIPTLHAVASGYDEAATEAQRMGLLTAAQAARADDANDKLDILAQTLRTRLAMSLTDNIGPVTALINGLGNLASEALQVGAAIESAADRALIASQAFAAALRRVMMGAGIIGPGLFQVMEARSAATVRDARARQANAGIIDAFRFNQEFYRRRSLPPLGGDDVDFRLPSGGRGGRGGGSGRAEDAQRRADEEARRRAEVETELRRARMDELRAAQEAATNEQRRAELGREIARLEDEQRAADRALSVTLRDRTATEADALAAVQSRLATFEREAIDAEERQRLAEQRVELDGISYETARERLQTEADAADTAEERRRAEFALLELTYRHERAKLAAIVADETASDHARARAAAEMRLLDVGQRGIRADAYRRTMGPFEEFLRDLPTTAERANEALQGIAAEGLQSITDGLADAILGARSWGDVMRSVVAQVANDLLRLQIQRLITAPLANMLGGAAFGIGKGGGIAGIASAFAGAAASAGGVRKFAAGGSFRVGGLPGIDRNILSLNGRPVALVSQGEDVDISRRGGRGGVTIGSIQVVAPNTGDPRRDRQSAMQQAAVIRDEIARAARSGF